jgi:hypothetical protein
LIETIGRAICKSGHPFAKTFLKLRKARASPPGRQRLLVFAFRKSQTHETQSFPLINGSQYSTTKNQNALSFVPSQLPNPSKFPIGSLLHTRKTHHFCHKKSNSQQIMPKLAPSARENTQFPAQFCTYCHSPGRTKVQLHAQGGENGAFYLFRNPACP